MASLTSSNIYRPLKLLYVSTSLAMTPKALRYVLSKVHPWTIYWSLFDFTIEDINGCNKVFADALTRWARGHGTKEATTGKIALVYLDLVHSLENLHIMEMGEIWSAQRNYNAPLRVKMNSEDVVAKRNGMWIPKSQQEMKLRIFVTANCRKGGYHGHHATKVRVKSSFSWRNLETDVQELVQSGLHCIISRTGKGFPDRWRWHYRESVSKRLKRWTS